VEGEQLLRSRDFGSIVVASSLSAFGDELALIALTLKVAELSDSGWAVSGLLLSGLAPLVVLAPISGLIVDRTEASRTLFGASIAQGGLAVALAFTANLPAIFLMSFLLGSAAAVANPALFSLVPVISGEERVTQANSALESARYVGWVAGPIAAGTLAVTFGTSSALLVDAASFVVIAFAAATLRARKPGIPTSDGERGRGEARAGFTVIGRDRLLRLTVGAMAVMIVFAAMDNVAEVFFARDVLDAGSFGYGALATAWLVGMVGGATLARWLASELLAPAALGAAVVGGAALITAAGFANYPLAILMFAVGGVANGIESVSIRSLIHKRAPEHVRGRVFAAYSGLAVGAQLGATAAGGAVMTLAGARQTLMIGGVGSAVVGLAGLGWLATLPSRERRMPVVIPDEGEPKPAGRVLADTWAAGPR
jgi:MFS family permease